MIPSSAALSFLSTPSARRATTVEVDDPDIFEFLSTPSARRATFYNFNDELIRLFLSTPSARRATRRLSTGD